MSAPLPGGHRLPLSARRASLDTLRQHDDLTHRLTDVDRHRRRSVDTLPRRTSDGYERLLPPRPKRPCPPPPPLLALPVLIPPPMPLSVPGGSSSLPSPIAVPRHASGSMDLDDFAAIVGGLPSAPSAPPESPTEAPPPLPPPTVPRPPSTSTLEPDHDSRSRASVPESPTLKEAPPTVDLLAARVACIGDPARSAFVSTGDARVSIPEDSSSDAHVSSKADAPLSPCGEGLAMIMLIILGALLGVIFSVFSFIFNCCLPSLRGFPWRRNLFNIGCAIGVIAQASLVVVLAINIKRWNHEYASSPQVSKQYRYQ